MSSDVIVIGGGPAGLSAALNARARGKTVTVVSNPLEENPLWRAERVENYLGLPGVSGAELLTAFQRHAESSGAEFLEGRALSALRSGEDWYVSVGNTMAQAKGWCWRPAWQPLKAIPVKREARATAGRSAGRTGPAIFPGPENLAALGPEAAEAALLGLPREDVLRAWGEPDGCLSGLFGDIYTLESGARITVYYDTEPMSQGTADGQTVPVERVLISESD